MTETIGYLLTLNAIITWALASLVYKFGLGKTDAKSNIFFRLVIVSISTFILSLIFGSYAFLVKFNQNELIGYIVACSASGIAVTLGDLAYFYSLKKIDASRAYPLTQLSLVFVYPLAFFLFHERITISILIGGLVILSSVFILSSKDKPKESNSSQRLKKSKDDEKNPNRVDHNTEDLFLGIILGVLTAFLWAIAIVSFNQARIINDDVFVINFIRLIIATIIISFIGIFQRDFFLGFKKEGRKNLKYYLYIGIAGTLTLGLADTFFYKAAEINGLVLTSTITANTPMVQQIFSIIFLKEKFRKRFIIAVMLIIVGNYIILFL